MITNGLKCLQLIFDEKVPRKVYNVKSGFISEERKYSAGNRENWPKNSREQGTLAKKQPGTGNIGLKTAGNREHCTPPFRVSSPKTLKNSFFVKVGMKWAYVATISTRVVSLES